MKEKKVKKEKKRDKGDDIVSVFDDAVRGALGANIGKCGVLGRLLRKADVCGRPWFLLGGNAGCGKTSLLVKSGIAWNFLHPDNHLKPGHEIPGWFFTEKAVYIDAPGVLSEPAKWSALCAALKKNRLLRRRAADGLLFVLDICEFLKSDRASIDKMAVALRYQADALMAATGYNIPTYFIFSKCDRIDGFRELFSDKKVAGRMPVVGTLIEDNKSSRSPAEFFSSLYNKVYDDLSDQCILKSVDTDIPEECRSISSLMPEFLLMESKLSLFIEEFFKNRGRASAPQFGGFFFTSSKMEDSRRPAETSSFSFHLLSEILPNAKFRTKHSAEGTPLYRVKKISCRLLITIIWLATVYCITESALRDALYMRSAVNEISSLCDGEPTLEMQYAVLEILRRSDDFLREGVIKHPGRIIFKTDKARDKIEEVYIPASHQILTAPAAAQIEASIQRRAERRGELTADEHQSLYRSLETYLLLTSGNPMTAAIDAASASESIENALKISYGQQYKSLNEQHIKDNVRAAIRLAANGLYEQSSNEKLVQAAREKLARAPSAKTVYRAVMDKLQSKRPAVPINQILGKTEILKFGREVSTLYTRDGWEQEVYAALADASKDPFKSDWVMGSVKAKVDEDKLLSDLVTLYTDDLCNKWLDFIQNTSVNVSRDSDIVQLAHDLEKLSSSESEIGKMLAAVCSLATQPQGDMSLPQMPTSITDIKGQISGISNKLRGNLQALTRNTSDPFAEAQKHSAPSRHF